MGLPGTMRRRVRIAVVDSGVHGAHPHVGRNLSGISIGLDGAHGGDTSDRLGHGTAVAAVICEKAPDAELISVKIFDDTLTTTGIALASAIEWAAGQTVQLINLSLGTENQAHEGRLAQAVAVARARGAWVVAAAPQDGLRWLPGAQADVISVEVDWALARDEVRVVSSPLTAGLRLAASGYPRPIPGVDPIRNFRGPSFAVANATGVIARLLGERPSASADELQEWLT